MMLMIALIGVSVGGLIVREAKSTQSIKFAPAKAVIGKRIR